jgi:predicted Rossmann fold nucleotide-binding protein DprA/Smf involved in DNA uptake
MHEQSTIAEPAGPEREIIRALAWGPLDVESLIANSGLTAKQTVAGVTGLEVKGLVRRLPGSVFALA